MMNRLIMITLVALIGMMGSTETKAQAQGKNSQEYVRQLNIYNKAKYYNDAITARSALYNLIELDPADNSLLDSLAFEFYSYRQFTSSLLASIESLKRNGNNLAMLELKAICWENIGDRSKALESYEALFLKNNSSITLYKIAFLQLDLERFAEATTSSDILMGKQDITEINLTFSKKDNTSQEIPLKAAIQNLKGLIAKNQGNKEEAKKYFSDAVATSPEFEVAQNNLSEIDS